METTFTLFAKKSSRKKPTAKSKKLVLISLALSEFAVSFYLWPHHCLKQSWFACKFKFQKVTLNYDQQLMKISNLTLVAFVILCCVVYCANPKAGRTTFFSRFQPFLFISNLFQWFHTWNQLFLFYFKHFFVYFRREITVKGLKWT